MAGIAARGTPDHLETAELAARLRRLGSGIGHDRFALRVVRMGGNGRATKSGRALGGDSIPQTATAPHIVRCVQCNTGLELDTGVPSNDLGANALQRL